MRKFFVAVLVAFLGFAPAHADKMVNVEYIHKLIEQRWDIKIPYSPKLSTPKVAANMKYLLTLVDMTNKRINGTATTHYGDGEFATMAAADTVAANRAIKKLVKIKPKFFITTTPDTTEFTFQMSARGVFMVDWGDGKSDIIKRTDTNNQIYSHEYADAGEYKIGIGGYATGYNTDDVAAISFGAKKNTTNTTVAGISGSLGAIFSTIGDGSVPGQQPRFYGLFRSCKSLTGEIPPDLFAGVHGAPVSSMFRDIFYMCTGLTTSIPDGLFGGLRGAPAARMFNATFEHCPNLTGSIPAGLFGKISGAPAEYMYESTFYDCGNISGEIPDKLFGEFNGAPAPYMFAYTFYYCSKLSGEIPANLFAGISGAPAPYMYAGTFVWNARLTGAIPPKLFGDIYGEPAEHMFAGTFFNCNQLTGIPAGLFGNLYGAPAMGMFAGTFFLCGKLTEIPAGLFGKLSGAPAVGMFQNTFNDCVRLTGPIPDDLFGNISGPAADGMFNGTFYDCKRMSGKSAKIGTEYLYNIWPDATEKQIGNCYTNDTELSDYDAIPDVWKTTPEQ